MTIIEKIRACQECGIRKYQLPVLDEEPPQGEKLVMCVDYTAPLLPQNMRNTPPDFDRCFPAGPMLEPALKELARFGYTFYGAYLLKCPPLLNETPRKPTKYELSSCFRHLQLEIETYRPQAVLLLGQGTYLNVLSLLNIPYRKAYGYYFNIYRHHGVSYAAIPHPGTLDKFHDNPSLYMEGIVSAVKRCSEQED